MTAPVLGVALPTPAPSTLFRPEGDPGGLDRLAAVVLEASGRYDEFSREARELTRMGVSQGRTVRSYSTMVRRRGRDAERTADSAKRVGRVLLACADRLRGHLRTAEELVERKRLLDARLEQLTAEVRAAAGVSMPPGQVAGLQARADDLSADYRRLVHDDGALRDRVRDNEELLRQTLASATTLDDVQSVDGGRPDVGRRAMSMPGAPGGRDNRDAVREWWRRLSAEERRAVTASYAHLIADADGLPEQVRERAERIRDEEAGVRLRSKADDGIATSRETERLDRLEGGA